MKISFVEVQNFRKLKSTHIGFDDKTTLSVGANNSGKTSAMIAMRYFLASPNMQKPKLSFRDITIENWTRIDEIGAAWEKNLDPVTELATLLPALDVWLEVPIEEIHHVVHALPTIDWCGGLLDVRPQYQPKEIETLKARFLSARACVIDVQKMASGSDKGRVLEQPPSTLTDFLEVYMRNLFEVKAALWYFPHG